MQAESEASNELDSSSDESDCTLILMMSTTPINCFIVKETSDHKTNIINGYLDPKLVKKERSFLDLSRVNNFFLLYRFAHISKSSVGAYFTTNILK